MSEIILANDYNSDNVNIENIVAKIKRESVRRRNTPTNKNIVSERVIGKTKAGKEVMGGYVEHQYAQKWLDEEFPGWSFCIIPDSFKVFAEHVYVAGELTVYDNGLKRTIRSYGADKAEYKQNTNDMVDMPYVKSAESDAFKRCCTKLGWAFDVYGGEQDKILSENTEDFVWFLDTFMPILVSRNKDNPARVFAAINSFYYGNTTKQQIINVYKTQGIEL